MRRLGLLALGVLCGAFAVSGQDDSKGDALVQEIDRLRKLLAERIEKETPPEEQQIVARTYDVADLCTPIRDHAQSLEDLRPSRYQPPESEELPEPWSPFEVDSLIELMKIGIEPACWEMEGAGIQPKNQRLFVSTTPRVHAKIERMLAWCRTAMDRRISVEVAFVPVREAEAGFLSGALELTAEEAEPLLARALGTVTLAGWDGQLLGGRTGREISYLQDFDVKLAGGSAIADPVTRRIFAGCSAQVHACLDDAQGAILHCQLEFSRIAEPIPVQPTEHGDVELPTKQLTRIQSSFWAPLGKTVVAGGCTVGEDRCVILVTARRK